MIAPKISGATTRVLALAIGQCKIRNWDGIVPVESGIASGDPEIGWRLRALERAAEPRLPHELAVCAIFRNEACHLHEWLEFHAGIGATHFFLYDNFFRRRL